MSRLENQILKYNHNWAKRLGLVSVSDETADDFKSDKDFCILPWVSLQLTPTGVSTCCSMTTKLSVDPNEGLTEIFNNGNAQRIRKTFTEKKIPTSCKACVTASWNTPTYKDIQAPFWQERVPEFLSKTSPDGNYSGPIRYLDLRFSNSCNFACRMCDSFSSSRWTKFDLELGRGHMKFFDWAANDQAIRSVIEALPSVEKIYFAGGEPFINEGHYKVLNWLIENGRKDVEIIYNTNLSVRNYKKYDLLEIWKNFERVRVFPSIDSIGKPGEYIREGFNWDTIQSNFSYFWPYIKNVQAVVSVYNIFSVLDLFEWCKRENFILNLSNVYRPSYMATTILPRSLKLKVRDRYLKFFEQNHYVLHETEERGMRDVLDFMLSTDDSHLAGEFWRVNEHLDKALKKSFTDTFPELAEWYREISPNKTLTGIHRPQSKRAHYRPHFRE